MNRRTFVQTGAFGTLALPAAQTAVKLEKLEWFRLKVPRAPWLIARIHASNGASGLGDASHADMQAVHMMEPFFEFVKGKPPLTVEALRRHALPIVAEHGAPAAVAFSAIEQCMWDIAGKVHGLPVHALLGGAYLQKIRLYANISRATADRTPSGFSKWAARAVEAGFDAVKLAPFDAMHGKYQAGADAERLIGEGIRAAAAVRDAIGPKRDLLIDVHERVNLERGLRLASELVPYNLFWLEETVPDVEGLAAIRRAGIVRTAGGEKRFGVRGFFPYLAAGAVDIAMPDVKMAGGILEVKKIGAMAEGAGALVSPHGPASPVGGIAAAHVCATMNNFLILEHAFGEVPWRAEMIDPPETIEPGGYLKLGDRPGLGIQLNMKTVIEQQLS
jgi:galactonate dehydratase